MLAAYHFNLSHKIISAKNTLAKLSNKVRIKVKSGNSVKWIILWALEQTKPDVLWICIQCFDRIGFIKVWVFPVRMFLSFLGCADLTVPGNDLFCSLSLGERTTQYLSSIQPQSSNIWQCITESTCAAGISWNQSLHSILHFLDNLHCPHDSHSGCSESAVRQTSKDLGGRKAQALSHKGGVGATRPDHLALRTRAQPFCRI